jgi:hypothetical protein
VASRIELPDGIDYTAWLREIAKTPGIEEVGVMTLIDGKPDVFAAFAVSDPIQVPHTDERLHIFANADIEVGERLTDLAGVMNDIRNGEGLKALDWFVEMMEGDLQFNRHRVGSVRMRSSIQIATRTSRP